MRSANTITPGPLTTGLGRMLAIVVEEVRNALARAETSGASI
jgi:hypothetical protein